MTNRALLQRNSILAMILISLFLLSACGQAPPQATPPAPTTTSLPPTATPLPPKTLVVCLGAEPQNLYLYGDSSRQNGVSSKPSMMDR